MDDARRQIWTLRTLVLLVVIGLGLGSYHVWTVNSRLNALAEHLESSVDALESNLESESTSLRQEISLVDTKAQKSIESLDQQISGVQEDVAKTKEDTTTQFAALSGQLTDIETQQEEQIAGLEEQMTKLKVEASDFSGIIEDVVKGVVQLRTDTGSGSGAIIHDEGYLVTNYHVIEGITKLSIYTFNGSVYPGALIATNPDADLALLKIGGAAQEFNVLRFGDSDDVRVGEKVIAVGNPGGFDFSVTEGIISNTNRQDEQGTPLLQIDVPINPGNSGGPLVNTAGRIIGINTKKLAGYEGVGFAVASNTVEAFVDAGLP